MTSIKDALKQVRTVYKSLYLEDDYTIVMKNNDTYAMDSRASEPNGINVFAGNINDYEDVPEGAVINKQSLPDKTKEAIRQRVEAEGYSQLSGKDFHELGYNMAYKGDFAFKNAGKGDISSRWKKGAVVPIDEIDDYASDTAEFPQWQETVGEKLKAASRHEDEDIADEIYGDYLWEWIYGYSFGIREQLENEGCMIEEE